MRLSRLLDMLGYGFVSIHAPREGCDLSVLPVMCHSVLFQFTHPGRGATSLRPPLASFQPQFQFTHPGRGATLQIKLYLLVQVSFNSRTPGGVRRSRRSNDAYRNPVSIHAPREGCDGTRNYQMIGSKGFNSRTPGGVRLRRRRHIRQLK